jgi:hypothetical protein
VTFEEEQADILELALRLQQASAEQATNIYRQIAEGCQQDLARAKAELAVVRDRIGDLLSQPYAPSSLAIGNAVFYPDEDRIQALISQATEDSPWKFGSDA